MSAFHVSLEADAFASSLKFTEDSGQTDYTDPLHLNHVAIGHGLMSSSCSVPSIHLAPDMCHKNNHSGGPSYSIYLRTDSPSNSQAYPRMCAGLTVLDPLIVHVFDAELTEKFVESCLIRKEDPLSSDIFDVLQERWLSEEPSMSRHDVNVNLLQYANATGRWINASPGDGSGPPTLLAYLRRALLEHGGFPEMSKDNALFEPLRRQLIADLEPF